MRLLMYDGITPCSAGLYGVPKTLRRCHSEEFAWAFGPPWELKITLRSPAAQSSQWRKKEATLVVFPTRFSGEPQALLSPFAVPLRMALSGEKRLAVKLREGRISLGVQRTQGKLLRGAHPAQRKIIPCALRTTAKRSGPATTP